MKIRALILLGIVGSMTACGQSPLKSSSAKPIVSESSQPIIQAKLDPVVVNLKSNDEQIPFEMNIKISSPIVKTFKVKTFNQKNLPPKKNMVTKYEILIADIVNNPSLSDFNFNFESNSDWFICVEKKSIAFKMGVKLKLLLQKQGLHVQLKPNCNVKPKYIILEKK